MKLYLARHGEAQHGENDALRPLSEKGIQDVTFLAEYLRDRSLKVEHIFHSGRLRAQQTADLLKIAFHFDNNTQSLPGLDPNDSVAHMAYEINSWQEDTLLVGHLPFMAKLLAKLVVGDENKLFAEFNAGSIACLNKIGSNVWLLNWLIDPVLMQKF